MHLLFDYNNNNNNGINHLIKKKRFLKIIFTNNYCRVRKTQVKFMLYRVRKKKKRQIQNLRNVASHSHLLWMSDRVHHLFECFAVVLS